MSKEEQKALQDCADDMGRATFWGSMAGFGFSYFLTRMGKVPFAPKLFFNVSSFLFGGYLGMTSGKAKKRH